jgi:hypothetical protein
MFQVAGTGERAAVVVVVVVVDQVESFPPEEGETGWEEGGSPTSSVVT